mmetsp:Transcript_16626/g.47389  ORF Transcript_16626/g.47389 Transcript_16626/m.47389 type:complete len:235 (+) Transcript_16626:1592-2296(+)
MALDLACRAAAWNCCQASSTFLMRSVPMCSRHRRWILLARLRVRRDTTARRKVAMCPFMNTFVWPKAYCACCSASAVKMPRSTCSQVLLISALLSRLPLETGGPLASAEYAAQKAVYSIRSGSPLCRISSAEITPPCTSCSRTSGRFTIPGTICGFDLIQRTNSVSPRSSTSASSSSWVQNFSPSVALPACSSFPMSSLTLGLLEALRALDRCGSSASSDFGTQALTVYITVPA